MIRLVVDSSADYTAEELKEKNIHLVPLSVSLNDANYLDGVNITRNELYQWLITEKGFPKTSQPSPQVFADLFEEARKCGDEVICILLSSALSGTYQSACMAKDMVEYDKIHIIDSLSATYTIKIMTDLANQMRHQGQTAVEIVDALEHLKARIRIAAGLDTLEYLYRGGRLNRATAAIGTLANLKPLITVTTAGEVAVIGKCIGKNKMIGHLLNVLQSADIDPSFPLYTIYTYGEENTALLEEKLTANGFTFTERKQVGATIGSHIGPGACGVIYVEKGDLPC